MSDRIVIDPEDLRRVATRMRGAALLLSSTGRELASRSLPTMPQAVAALVAESLARVNAEVQDLAAGLVREAGHLLGRATWAEIDGGHSAGWLSPRSGELVFQAAGDVDPAAHLPVGAEEQVARAEAWAVDLVTADDPPPADAGVGDASDLRRLLARGFSAPDEAVPPASLGDLTLVAESAPEVVDARALGGALPAPSVGGGALGSALTEVASSPTGAGILGCISVGAGTESAEPASDPE